MCTTNGILGISEIIHKGQIITNLPYDKKLAQLGFGVEAETIVDVIIVGDTTLKLDVKLIIDAEYSCLNHQVQINIGTNTFFEDLQCQINAFISTQSCQSVDSGSKSVAMPFCIVVDAGRSEISLS